MSNSSSDDSLLNKVNTCFDHAIIKEALKSKFANPKNKITDEAVELVSEITKVMVIEATARAVHQANLENKKKISLEHVEIALPQIVCKRCVMKEREFRPQLNTSECIILNIRFPSSMTGF